MALFTRTALLSAHRQAVKSGDNRRALSLEADAKRLGEYDNWQTWREMVAQRTAS